MQKSAQNDYRDSNEYDISQYSRDRQSKNLGAAFVDYLQLNEIVRDDPDAPYSKIVSADMVITREQKVEVMQSDDRTSPHDEHPVTVLVHRDESNDMRSIEIVCSCGKRTVVALEYEDSYDSFAS